MKDSVTRKSLELGVTRRDNTNYQEQYRKLRQKTEELMTKSVPRAKVLLRIN